MSKSLGKDEQERPLNIGDPNITDFDGHKVDTAGQKSDGADAGTALEEAAAAAIADSPSIMSTLNALNSTLQAFSQALGDQASRVTAMEEKMVELCVAPDALSSAPVCKNQTTLDDPIGTTADLRAGPIKSTRSTQGDTVGRRFAKPQEFDGSTPWRSFIIQFESIADGHGWSSAEKRGELVACLRDSALEVFSHLPDADRADYRRLVASLEGRFGVTQQEPWFRSQLRRRTRGVGETLPSLARDVERLVAMAYPTAVQELRDSLACDHFVDALNDVDLQVAVRQGRPASLQEALAHAVEIDAIRRSVRPSRTEASGGSVFVRAGTAAENELPGESRASDAPCTADALRQILHSLGELKRDLNRVPAGRSRGRGRGRGAWGSGTPGACWSCGERGHIRRDCPRVLSRNAPEN